jgi:assimilatory nitrate reductase catalytic subunit
VPATSTATHCPYCALQCGILMSTDPEGIALEPDPRFPVNKGGLCMKGWSAASLLAHPDRLREPMVRAKSGVLSPVSWDTALAHVAERFLAVQASHGRDAVGVFGGGSLTNEKVYLLGKFARVVLGTANIDYNGRFCMSSAAAAGNRAFGIDRGLPFPLEDIAGASTILLVGGNPAETMPPIMQYFEAQQRDGGRLIVADPRRTATANWASTHLPLRPGTDAALANGLLHILIRDRLIDETFISERTEGFDAARCVAASYWPERVERITGVPEAALIETAHALGRSRSAMILTARGPEQQSQGVNNALAYINVVLALGAVGKQHGGFGTLTGQGNGQGGREQGQKSDQLPGYRMLTDPAARRHLARIWQIDETELPQPGKSAYELLDSLGRDVRALLIIGSNPVVSAPNALHISERLAALDTLVVAEFFLSETAQLADVVLPAAQWAEEGGTMTNLEGRVIRRRRAVAPPEGVRTDLEILSGLATALGRPRGFTYASERDVFNELREATSGGIADYAGMSYERLEANDGLFWPCPDESHPGTPRLFADRFYTPSGRARFHATPHREIADARSADYPLLLTTGRVLAHYQSGTQTRRVEKLQDTVPEPLAEVHPATAERNGLTDGESVVLTSARGQATFKAKLTRSIREDTIFVPFHWSGEQSANRLTSDALDPISRMPEFKVCAVQASPAAGVLAVEQVLDEEAV